MNMLDELKHQQASEDAFFCNEDFASGWDAAIALGLPVKFLIWYNDDLKHWSQDKVQEDVYDKLGKDGLTDQEWYDYWIENVFKPE